VSKLSEEDKSLFASAMQEVVPIKNDKKIEQQSPKIQAKRLQKTIQQLRHKQRVQQNQLNEHASIHQYEKYETVSAFDNLLHHRKGIRLQDLSRLKKGEYPIEAELDLHGLTEIDADETLQHFINRCYQHNKRCVLIIHGKGYNSEASAPVLKNLVNMRLRQIKKVLAYCSSLPKDGGTGSVYALLKAH